jgi:hypothetical protein
MPRGTFAVILLKWSFTKKQSFSLGADGSKKKKLLACSWPAADGGFD